ncbi:MAG: metallophosphoesterase family protein [Acidiferrobacterales bacterium]
MIAKHISGSGVVRLGIVSDTHGRVDLRIVDVIARCEYAVHAGDIGNAGVLRQLRPRHGPLLAIRGNNDTSQKWPDRQRHTLQGLPDQLEIELPGGCLVVVHGHRTGPVRNRHASLREHFPQVHAIVYGHSHRLVCDQSRLPWVLNPGAAGHSRTFGGPSCLVIEARMHRWTVQAFRFSIQPERDQHRGGRTSSTRGGQRMPQKRAATS